MRLLCSAHERVSPFLRKTVQEQPSSRGGCSLSRRFRPALQRLSCRGRGRPQAGAVETPGAAHPAPLGAHGHQRGLHRDPEGGSAWPAVPAHPPHPDCPANSWPQPGQVWLPLRGPLCSHQRALPCHHLVGPSAPPAALGVLLASRLRIRSALCRYLFVPHSGFLVLACTSCQDPVFTPPPPPAPVVPSVPEPAGCPTSPAAHASLRSTVS